jgi:WD40 repeat protein
LADGTLLRTLRGHTEGVIAVHVASGGREVITVGGTIKIWDLKSGRLLRGVTTQGMIHVAISLDGTKAVTAANLGGRPVLWDLTTGKRLKEVGHEYRHPRERFSFFPDGRRLVQGSTRNTITVFDVQTGLSLYAIERPALSPKDLVILPGGEHVLQTAGQNEVLLVNLRTGQFIRKLERSPAEIYHLAASPDGRHVVGASSRYLNSINKLGVRVPIWDLASGRIVGAIGQPDDYGGHVEFSPDGRLIATNGPRPALWNFATGFLIRRFDKGVSDRALFFSAEGRAVYNAKGRWEVWKLDGDRALKQAEGGGNIVALHGREAILLDCVSDGLSLALSDIVQGRAIGQVITDLPCSSWVRINDQTAVVASVWGDLEVWNLAQGRRIQQFEGHASYIDAVAVSLDGSRIISGGADGVKIWSPNLSSPVVTLLAHDTRRWLAISNSGFFSGTPAGGELFSIIRGLDNFRIDQVHQSLFNPDLVREALAGDPDGEVAQATKVINLEKVLDSGPAPSVVITSPASGSQSTAELVEVRARIENRGKGVGRIEWRVNGITAAVDAKPASSGPVYTVIRRLALNPGANTIEVVAYNGSNLLASLPASTTVRFTGPADKIKPKLHLLAIGINAYEDKGWTPPGSNDAFLFEPLDLAVKDAKAFAAGMEMAAAGLYDEVRITLALDRDATRAKLGKTVDKVAASVHPRDTFILFAAAHGYSTKTNGRFYLIPQDHQGGINPEALATRAIGQDQLQDWLANRIKAKRAVILLDTCESGALIAGHTRSRTDVPASEAAVGRLHEATGRPVLTAAAVGQSAHEGEIGSSGQAHGYFTWAMLDALRNGDSNGNGLIELSELVTHVQAVVPRIAAKGGNRGHAVTSEQIGEKQASRFGSRGEDFVVVRRLQ